MTMRAPWVGQTDNGIYDIRIARHQTLRSHTQFHPHCLLRVYQSVSHSSKTYIYSIVPCVASESDASHGAQRPPTTNVSHATTACCQFDYRLIIGYGNSKIGYEIIRVSHPYYSVPFSSVWIRDIRVVSTTSNSWRPAVWQWSRLVRRTGDPGLIRRQGPGSVRWSRAAERHRPSIPLAAGVQVTVRWFKRIIVRRRNLD